MERRLAHDSRCQRVGLYSFSSSSHYQEEGNMITLDSISVSTSAAAEKCSSTRLVYSSPNVNVMISIISLVFSCSQSEYHAHGRPIP